LRILYVLLGLGLVGSALTADTRGWLGTRPSTLRNVPRSIRENPGAYRALYRGSPRLFGGK
jgi:hypothetical protein